MSKRTRVAICAAQCKGAAQRLCPVEESKASKGCKAHRTRYGYACKASGGALLGDAGPRNGWAVNDARAAAWHGRLRSEVPPAPPLWALLTADALTICESSQPVSAYRIWHAHGSREAAYEAFGQVSRINRPMHRRDPGKQGVGCGGGAL